MLEEEIVENTQVNESGINADVEMDNILEDISLKRIQLNKMGILEKEIKELKVLEDNVKRKRSRIKKLYEQISH